MHGLPPLTGVIEPATVLAALMRHVGAANGVSATQLATEVLGTHCEAADERRLRQVIHLLRTQGHAVCATPEEGYYLACSADELNRTCLFLMRRLMTSAQQVAAMKRIALPDFYGQLGLPMPDDQPFLEGEP